MAIQAPNPTHDNPYAPGRMALLGGIWAATGALAAGLFTSISPIGGAIFGIGSLGGNYLVHWLCEKTNVPQESTLSKVISCVLKVLGGVFIGAFAATLLGFPISFTAGIILTAAMIGTALITIPIFTCCLGYPVIGSGVYLVQNDTVRA